MHAPVCFKLIIWTKTWISKGFAIDWPTFLFNQISWLCFCGKCTITQWWECHLGKITRIRDIFLVRAVRIFFFSPWPLSSPFLSSRHILHEAAPPARQDGRRRLYSSRCRHGRATHGSEWTTQQSMQIPSSRRVLEIRAPIMINATAFSSFFPCRASMPK